MRIAMLIVASLVLFIIAAKTHGRELRLEREAAGISHVIFGGQNPPFVEALWQAERVRFAIAAPLCAILVGAGLWLLGASLSRIALGALAFGPTAAFLMLGVASFIRGGALLRGQVTGSLAWWTVLLCTGGIVGWAGWVRQTA